MSLQSSISDNWYVKKLHPYFHVEIFIYRQIYKQCFNFRFCALTADDCLHLGWWIQISACAKDRPFNISMVIGFSIRWQCIIQIIILFRVGDYRIWSLTWRTRRFYVKIDKHKQLSMDSTEILSSSSLTILVCSSRYHLTSWAVSFLSEG